MRGIIGAAVAVGLLLVGMLYQASIAPAFTATQAGPVVKVVMAKSHGSGVHIGGGYIVTAAHVVGDEIEVKLKGDDGRTAKAEVLWRNEARDVALLMTDGRQFDSDRLSCTMEPEGTLIYARGNPLSMEFVTMWGRIAGVAREVGPWKVAYVGDITILPGMSGGPAYNMQGEVIGINIGLASARNGPVMSFTGMTFLVPSRTVCQMLGRD